MGLIHELEILQEREGHLRESDLRTLAARTGTPLYRLQELASYYPHFRTRPRPPVQIDVCRDMSCHLAGADAAADALEEALASREDVRIERASCLGCCELAPAVRVNGVPAGAVDPPALAERIREGRIESPPPSEGPYRCDPYADEEEGHAFEAVRRLLGRPDRDSAAEELIATLEESGLRGMGGAGFPTGRKWALVRAEEATPKYVVCNADESEPGTFKDRVIMERLPHLVLEGLMLGGIAVGARRGIIYLRHEYGRAREALENEVRRAREVGWLGEDVLGSGIDFEVEIFISPGGYILGEETALLEALEDRRGEPRNKPPFPGQVGLYGKPTLMNNVETLAFVPAIALRGAEWWKGQGRDGHAGLKFMAVSGHVERPGVYEVPMGIPVSELIETAGGVSGGRALKAFAPGGASSRFLPADRADVALDFGSLSEAGSMMGSGALVVVADGTPMLPLAANVVRFFRNESCGKCVPCRDGTQKAVRMLERALGDGAALDWTTIEKLNLLLVETSICGLGYVALNPLLSAAEHWPDEVPRNGGAPDSD